MKPEPRIRPASRADLPAIIRLLADDGIGKSREGAPEDPAYAAAFAAIERDLNNTIYVIDRGGEVAGCAQLTLIPGLSRRGATRALIEAVRVSSRHRGEGLGRWFFEQLIAVARKAGCRLVQLTSDKRRSDAHRFYESLGFVGSHEGYKLTLE
jgi:GNAT superfamily N-acetyltransferase